MDPITIPPRCASCGQPLKGGGRQRFCSNACRQKAHRVRQASSRQRTCLFCGAELPSTVGRPGRPQTYCDDYCQQAALLGRLRPDADADLAAVRAQVVELRSALAALGTALRDIEGHLPRRQRRPAPGDPYAEAYRALAKAVRSALKQSAAKEADRVPTPEAAGTARAASRRSTGSGTTSRARSRRSSA
ncbi:MAG: hypothetical protein ACRDKW_17695 [Actinomycetota bacterium]